MPYAQIVPLASIPLAQKQIFTYYSREKLKIGQLVFMPLRQRPRQGIVVGFSQTADGIKGLKKIISVPLNYPLLTGSQIKLAYFTADYFCQPLGLVFKTITPPLPKRLAKEAMAANIPSQIKQAANNSPAPALSLALTDEILLKKIKLALKAKKQVLFLLPELTQILFWQDKLTYHFPTVPLAVLTGQTAKQKFFLFWRQALSQEPQIILGTRLAVFAPLAPGSLIIVYNEPNQSFKQWQMKPYYDARIVAREYARLGRHQLIFYSAAPRVSLFWQAKKQKFKLYRPTRPIRAGQATIVDMRRELNAGNYSIFSYPLIQALKNTLAQKKQAIFFVSRQGEYRLMICRDCGYVISCPHCRLGLVQTGRKTLACPLCGFTCAVPPACPNCQSVRFKNFGAGVKPTAREIKKLFPAAKVQTLDTETLASQRRLSQLYQHFDTGQIDILVGSQATLAWRPFHLGLVALINFDSLLFAPFFTASQQAFSLLAQITSPIEPAGAIPSRFSLIIQTYNPENKLLQWAIQGNYDDFFKQEIKLRQSLNYPPFFKLIKLENKGPNPAELLAAAAKEKARLIKILNQRRANGQLAKEVQIIGPTKAIKRPKDKFSLNLIIKVRAAKYQFYFTQAIKPFIFSLPPTWTADIDPERLV